MTIIDIYALEFDDQFPSLDRNLKKIFKYIVFLGHLSSKSIEVKAAGGGILLCYLASL